MSAAPAALALPALRPDVEVLAGPPDANGAPTYTVHDPVSGRFHQADWKQGEILHRLRDPVDAAELCEALAAETTLRLAPEAVVAFCHGLQQEGLTRGPRAKPEREQKRSLLGTWQFVFRHVLYWRIPLWRPDAFLAAADPWARLLVAWPLVWLVAAAGVLGLVGTLQQLETYLATLPAFLTVGGLLAFGVTLLAVKAGHELAHALTAHAYGCRVRTIGVALILLIPVAYSDVTDSWRLPDRRRRIAIALAGVAFELALAGIALLVWWLSPPGIMRSVAFVLSSVTLITTLLVNLNPLMRFDGYYALSDWLGIDNLQARAAEFLRQGFRRGVVGLALPAAEPGSPTRLRRMLGCYAVSAWLYRLVLFAGITWLLFHWGAKVVGIGLGVTAVATFFVGPVVREARTTWQLRRRFRPGWRQGVLWLVLLGAVLWIALPLPRRAAAPAVTFAAQEQTLYAPHAGKLTAINVRRGQAVTAGTPICVITPPSLDARRAAADHAVTATAVAQAQAEQTPGARTTLPRLVSQQARAEAERAGLAELAQRSVLRATTGGRLVTWSDVWRVGSYVPSGAVLGRIAGAGDVEVRAYVPVGRSDELAVGAEVWLQVGGGAWHAATVRQIAPAPAATITPAELTDQRGGPIAVTATRGQLVPRSGWRAVRCELINSESRPAVGTTGQLWYWTGPRSYLLDWLRYAGRVIVRESSF